MIHHATFVQNIFNYLLLVNFINVNGEMRKIKGEGKKKKRKEEQKKREESSQGASIQVIRELDTANYEDVQRSSQSGLYRRREDGLQSKLEN